MLTCTHAHHTTLCVCAHLPHMLIRKVQKEAAWLTGHLALSFWIHTVFIYVYSSLHKLCRWNWIKKRRCLLSDVCTKCCVPSSCAAWRRRWSLSCQTRWVIRRWSLSCKEVESQLPDKVSYKEVESPVWGGGVSVVRRWSVSCQTQWVIRRWSLSCKEVECQLPDTMSCKEVESPL